jgi:hypothetical protein
MNFKETTFFQETIKLFDKYVDELATFNLQPSYNEALNKWRLDAIFLEDFFIPIPGRLQSGENPKIFKIVDLTLFFKELDEIKPLLLKEDMPVWEKYCDYSDLLKKIYTLFIKCGCHVILKEEAEFEQQKLLASVTVDSLLKKTSRCVAEYEIELIENLPFQRLKIKIYSPLSNENIKYNGNTNIQIRDSTNSYYAALGLGKTIEEALNNTINNFLYMLNETGKVITESDFQYLEYSDF